jgi:hypothetical protein
MSGYRSKKLMSNDRQGQGIEIVGLNIEQAELLDAMWSFQDEEDLQEWQESLPLAKSQIVDSLIVTILLEHFDRILDIEPDYAVANEYLSRFTLQ